MHIICIGDIICDTVRHEYYISGILPNSIIYSSINAVPYYTDNEINANTATECDDAENDKIQSLKQALGKVRVSKTRLQQKYDLLELEKVNLENTINSLNRKILNYEKCNWGNKKSEYLSNIEKN